MRRDCLVLQDRNDRDVKKVEKEESLHVGGVHQKSSWFVDIDCTSHMAGDRKLFRKFDETGKEVVYLVDGWMEFDGREDMNKVTVKDVLYLHTFRD